MAMGVGVEGVSVACVKDGMKSLEANDDVAMGAPSEGRYRQVICRGI